MQKAEMLVSFWNDVARQNAASLGEYFLPGAYVRWNNTNEQFTVREYIMANCAYPGEWMGEVERMEEAGDIAVTVTRIWLADGSASFHATSFFEFEGEKIAVLNEYWGDDGSAPQWRLDKHIGKAIK